eukprot:scaffold5082_cov195-Ochromonas_danica.AAC.6
MVVVWKLLSARASASPSPSKEEVKQTISMSSRVKGVDPCEKDMEGYLKCVESQKDGLSDGNECLKEAERYKACRALSKKTSTTAKTVASEAVAARS